MNLESSEPLIPSHPQPPAGITTAAVVVYVVDGDTLDVEIRRTVRVRLLDCWAPESRTKDAEEKERGLAAKEHLRQLCPVGSHVVLHIPADPDGKIADVFTMGRALGRVYANPENNGPDVSQLQRLAGHATATKPQVNQGE